VLNSDWSSALFNRTFVGALLVYAVLMIEPVKTEATMDMAKASRKACVMCHRTAQGGKRGRPQLKPFGIRYLTMLIKKETYVPLNTYRKLNHLSQTIADNKKKIAAKKESEQKKSDELSQSAASTVEATASLVPETAESPDKEPDTPQPAVSAAEKTDRKRPRKKLIRKTAAGTSRTQAAEKTATSFVRSVKRSKPTTTEASAPGKSVTESGVPAPQIQPGKGIRFKGGKTFILKNKPKIVDVNYDWEDDWDYDSYF
jgi:hypothetical protein